MSATWTMDLEARWAELRQAEPHLRVREAAARLGTSEAGLLSLLLGKGVRRLMCEPAKILPRLEAWGSIMALTRNDGAVHERHGVYGPLKVQGNVGLVNTADIDLRLDFSPWTLAFAEEKEHAGRKLRSLQFFDATGLALHKIYAEEGQSEAWEALVREFLHEDQTTPFTHAKPPLTDPIDEPLSAQAQASLVEAWTELEDPHHFQALLKRHRSTRRQALAAAQGRFTRRVEAETLLKALTAAAGEVPIMVFVGNRGCTQIHTGIVNQIKTMGRWVNVLDPLFNLHVDLDTIAEAWAVEKPSPDGPVTSLEFLDSRGALVVQVFGERKPGRAELPRWKVLVGQL